MMGPAILAFLAATGSAWLLRELLLKHLRRSHPQALAALGDPTSRQLTSILPRNRETQLRFFRYVWSNEPFTLGDRGVSAFTWAIRAADLASAAAMALVFWAAALTR